MIPALLTLFERTFDNSLSGIGRKVFPEPLLGSVTAEFPCQQGGLQGLEPERYVQKPHLIGRDHATPHRDHTGFLLSRTHARQRPVETFAGDASRPIERTILFIGQVPIAAKKVFAFPHGLIKRKIFQAMHGVLGDHDLHGPKWRYRFAGPGNRLTDPVAFFLGKRMHRRGSHHSASCWERTEKKPTVPSISEGTRLARTVADRFIGEPATTQPSLSVQAQSPCLPSETQGLGDAGDSP